MNGHFSHRQGVSATEVDLRCGWLRSCTLPSVGSCQKGQALPSPTGAQPGGIHIPKTIDNDLVENDHTPGFPNAARFVSQAFAGANLDNAALPGIYIGVVMGRHAGFLTTSSALGKKFPDDGPHLIYLPERAFKLDHFLSEVKAAYERHSRCVIAVSEGIQDAKGHSIAEVLAKDIKRDEHGNVQLSGSGALADLL